MARTQSSLLGITPVSITPPQPNGTILTELDADRERVKRLTNWSWIADTLAQQDHAA